MTCAKYVTNVTAACAFSVLPFSPAYFRVTEAMSIKIDPAHYYVPAACEAIFSDAVAELGKHWTDADSNGFFVSVLR